VRGARNRAERKPAKVLIEPCGDDSGSVLGELERCADDGRLEELHLVDPEDLEAPRSRDELRHRRDRNAAHPSARVTDDVLAGDLRSPQPTNHLLTLAREHRPADDLEPAASLWGDPDHGRDPTSPTGRSDFRVGVR